MRSGSSLLVVCVLVVGASTSQAADWQLDGELSTVHFASVKNEAVGEVHRFTQISGQVAGGQVQVKIELASVETLIDIRNERMREMLFDVAAFPEANVSADVAALDLDAVAAGGMQNLSVPLEVNMHGRSQAFTASVRVVPVEKGVMVATEAPLMVRAADFGLEGGIEALRKVAGLNAIDRVVPVTFVLVFEPVARSAPRPPVGIDL